MMNYKKNHHNHIVFQTREHSNEINRRNERLFVRLQEIHSVSRLTDQFSPDFLNLRVRLFFVVTEKEKANGTV